MYCVLNCRNNSPSLILSEGEEYFSNTKFPHYLIMFRGNLKILSSSVSIIKVIFRLY